MMVNVVSQYHAKADLKQQFLVGLQSVARSRPSPGGQLQPVVHASENAQPSETNETHLHVEIRHVRQHHDRQGDGAEDHHPAHGGHVGFVAGEFVERSVIEFRPIAKLPPDQSPNQTGHENQQEEETYECRANATKERILVRVVTSLKELASKKIEHSPARSLRIGQRASESPVPVIRGESSAISGGPDGLFTNVGLKRGFTPPQPAGQRSLEATPRPDPTPSPATP